MEKIHNFLHDTLGRLKNYLGKGTGKRVFRHGQYRIGTASLVVLCNTRLKTGVCLDPTVHVVGVQPKTMAWAQGYLCLRVRCSPIYNTNSPSAYSQDLVNDCIGS